MRIPRPRPGTAVAATSRPPLNPRVSGALNMRFQPVRIPFETRASASQTTNIMQIAGKSVTSSIPVGNSGFQVVQIDPFDLSVVASNAYPPSVGCL